MKLRILVVAFSFTVIAMGLFAQETPKASLHLFSDEFAGADGAVFYPQYAWILKVPIGMASGYGSGEVAPYEDFFTNHLVIYTPSFATWFSVHTETGGYPNKGMHFFQIGPRINVPNAIPAIKKPIDHLFVTALPRFIGVRPNNILVAGATNQFKLGRNAQWWIEAYCRFFPQGQHYNEDWFLVHPKQTPHVSWGVFILNDTSSHTSVGFGGRLSLFHWSR